MDPKTAKTALLVVVLLVSSAGYLWHLRLYSREERSLRMVASSGYDTLEPPEKGYGFRSRAYADNVTLTFSATGDVTVTFLKWVDDGEGGLIEVPVRALTAKTLENYTFSGYEFVSIGLKPAGNSSVGIYFEIIKPRWETHKTHLEEATHYGYISSAGLLFVGSWLLLEALWWTYTTRIRSALRGRGRISQTRHRLLRLISPLPAAIILYWIGFITFGAVFYDRSPAPYESLLAWLLVTLVRTGIGLYATALARGRPLEQTLTKRNLLLAFFLVGPAHPLTQMTLINLTAITTWTKSLDPFLFTWLLQPVQEAVRAWFTSMGHSYEFFLSVYFAALDPFIVDLPRLLALILVNSVREPDQNNVNSSFYYGNIFLLFINTKSKEIRRTAKSISAK
ncbi:hypothetical protein H8E65_04685 [Candidatus Bathyarchaeota archaeon]|nr:hypothetical protein [Candidatus Bathyarchaeota archaeon]